MVSALLSTVPQAARDLFTNARLGDGTPLFSHPDMLRYFAGLARETNPAASVVPNSNQPAQAIDAEIDTLRSEEHTSELQSLMRHSYHVFCLKKKTTQTTRL